MINTHLRTIFLDIAIGRSKDTLYVSHNYHTSGGFAMQKRVILALFVLLSAIAIPLAASPGLQIEARAGAGLTMGTSSNSNSTGSADLASGGGLVLDFYVVDAGPVALGISAGAEYSALNFHGVTTYAAVPMFGLPATTQTSDSLYNYLLIPVSLVGHMQVSPNLGLTLRAGGFAAYFLGGNSTLSYTTQVPTVYVNGNNALTSSNTSQWEYGLHFSGGPDIGIGQRLTFSPSLEFNMGLTNAEVTTTDNPYKVTFWSLVVNVGIKYAIF